MFVEYSSNFFMLMSIENWKKKIIITEMWKLHNFCPFFYIKVEPEDIYWLLYNFYIYVLHASGILLKYENIHHFWQFPYLDFKLELEDIYCLFRNFVHTLLRHSNNFSMLMKKEFWWSKNTLLRFALMLTLCHLRQWGTLTMFSCTDFHLKTLKSNLTLIYDYYVPR